MDHAKKISTVMNFGVDMDDCKTVTIGGEKENFYVESGIHQYMPVAL
jgi:hypothetical protein